MSAMIRGPDNTPFRDAMFAFEIHFPPEYPSVPPHVHYISMCPRFNPNLYETGHVCVSLLGTWSGQGNENWTKDSSILQVLLSIQGLILNAEPYFNEAGYDSQRTTLAGLNRSRYYNEMVVLRSVEHVTTFINAPPNPFNNEDCSSMLREQIPRFIERIRALVSTSEQSALDEDISAISGFPLRTLSLGVRNGINERLTALVKSAKEKNLIQE